MLCLLGWYMFSECVLNVDVVQLVFDTGESLRDHGTEAPAVRRAGMHSVAGK